MNIQSSIFSHSNCNKCHKQLTSLTTLSYMTSHAGTAITLTVKYELLFSTSSPAWGCPYINSICLNLSRSVLWSRPFPLTSFANISCKKCGLLYIGETGWSLRVKFGKHRRSVNNHDNIKPVARPFTSCSHCVSDMKIRALSPISGTNDSCKRQEIRLIHRLSY